MTERTIE
jgi:hypothetical protein